MKQKDILVLVAVAIFAAIISLVLSNMLFAPPKSRSQQVETIDAINDTFTPPSTDYFNAQSVDPSQLIQIGPGNSIDPFN